MLRGRHVARSRLLAMTATRSGAGTGRRGRKRRGAFPCATGWLRRCAPRNDSAVGFAALNPPYEGTRNDKLLRLAARRGIGPLNDAALAEVFDLLVVVSDLPQYRLCVLADLCGGLVASRRQGGLEQPAITEVFAGHRMIHLDAQRIGLGVRMVHIELALRRFVGAHTSDVGFQQ